MAHFAEIKNNKVTQVIVISNDVLEGKDFPESEIIGQDFIASLNLSGTWKQTSYNHNFRGKYAGIGDTYDSDLDEFITPIVEEVIEESVEEEVIEEINDRSH